MKKLLQKILIIVLLSGVVSVGVDFMYRHTYGFGYSFPHNLWILPSIPDKYQLVKLGNSHAQDGITFARYRVRTLDLAGVAQSFEYDLANLKMHSRQIADNAVILIDVSPISFSESKPSREDSLQTQYYDGRLSPFLIPHLKVEDYIQSQLFPFLRAGFLWRQEVANRIQRRIDEEIQQAAPAPVPSPKPTSPKSQDSPGPSRYLSVSEAPATYYYNVNAIRHELATPSAAPSDMLIESMNFMFNKWYRTAGFGTQYFASNRADLERLIRYVLAHHWRPVLITIPISQVLINGLLPDYMQTYVYDNLARTDLLGVPYFDFSKDRQLTENKYLFSNSDHLNATGAVIFSYLLLRRLIDAGYLPQQADGYTYTPLYPTAARRAY